MSETYLPKICDACRHPAVCREEGACAEGKVESVKAGKRPDPLTELAQAAIAYDEAIMSCANDPERMASFYTAQGENLDVLYTNFIALARAYVKPSPEPPPAS